MTRLRKFGIAGRFSRIATDFQRLQGNINDCRGLREDFRDCGECGITEAISSDCEGIAGIAGFLKAV